MSRIDDLLEKSSPTGVPFKKLCDVAAYATARVSPADITVSTYIGVENLLPNAAGRVDAASVPARGGLIGYVCDDILIGNIRPYLKKIWLADRDGATNGDVLVVRISPAYRDLIIPRFLFYLLSSEQFFAHDMQHAKGAKMPRGDKAAILQYKVPVPPVDVQRAIVEGLDAFTVLHAELESELDARQLQYAYYRDSLLALEVTEIPESPLGMLATVIRGASPRPIREFLTNEPDGVPWIKIGDVAAGGKYITGTAERVTTAGAAKSRRVYPGDFVLSNSMSFGRPYLSKIEGCIHDGWLAIKDFNASFIPDFLYHLLRSTPVQAEFARRAGSGTVQNLNADIVKSVVVPIPPLADQERMVGILDKFDALVNDPEIGIPAELNARRKQYEYYRDRLLTFEELAV